MIWLFFPQGCDVVIHQGAKWLQLSYSQRLRTTQIPSLNGKRRWTTSQTLSVHVSWMPACWTHTVRHDDAASQLELFIVSDVSSVSGSATAEKLFIQDKKEQRMFGRHLGVKICFYFHFIVTVDFFWDWIGRKNLHYRTTQCCWIVCIFFLPVLVKQGLKWQLCHCSLFDFSTCHHVCVCSTRI